MTKKGVIAGLSFECVYVCKAAGSQAKILLSMKMDQRKRPWFCSFRGDAFSKGGGSNCERRGNKEFQSARA
jgi:hypothetical protein